MEWTMISALAGSTATLLSAFAVWNSMQIHKRQQLLQQRQLILPLWEYMVGVNAIDPEKPVAEDVRRVINSLELVAVCWEAGIVDSEVLHRTFAQTFVDSCNQIERTGRVQIGTQVLTGAEILARTHAVANLHNQLKIKLPAANALTRV